MKVTDQLVEGQPLPDGECWSRALTQLSYVRNGGVHPSALKNKRFGLVETHLPGWRYELSGRVVSKVADLEAEARERVNAEVRGILAKGDTVSSDKGFAGVALAGASRLRACADPKMDVVYTPKEVDTAHSDVLVNPHQDEDKSATIMKVANFLKVATPGSVASAAKTCGEETALDGPPLLNVASGRYTVR